MNDDGILKELEVLRGDLRALGAELTEREIASIGLGHDVRRLGLDSFAVLELVGRIEQRTGRTFSRERLSTVRTVAELLTVIQGEER